jgi:Spy/CpxP family protein refolding chaperone
VAANRQALARQVRQAFNAVVRRELDLNDEKWRHLQQVEKRYQQQRGQLQRDEREARVGLRTAMEDTARAGGVDEDKISHYLDQLVQAQHRRADLLDAEQKELASFLTPLQRAKYQGLREQLNQRVNAVRKANGRGAPPPAQP